jgi:hypothetical protein
MTEERRRAQRCNEIIPAFKTGWAVAPMPRPLEDELKFQSGYLREWLTCQAAAAFAAASAALPGS